VPAAGGPFGNRAALLDAAAVAARPQSGTQSTNARITHRVRLGPAARLITAEAQPKHDLQTRKSRRMDWTRHGLLSPAAVQTRARAQPNGTASGHAGNAFCIVVAPEHTMNTDTAASTMTQTATGNGTATTGAGTDTSTGSLVDTSTQTGVSTGSSVGSGTATGAATVAVTAVETGAATGAVTGTTTVGTGG
jgi:hypothetical protein